MEFLRDITSDIDRTNVLDDGLNSSEFSGTIDTGSHILNAALSGSLYGGVPNSKITIFAGESATGKTFFVLGLIKKFLEKDKDAGVIYFDTEAAVTKDMMTSRGIDPKRVVVSEPKSIEEFRTNAVRILKNYGTDKSGPPLMMVLDSLGMLSSKKELGDIEGGKDTRDMTKAQLLRGTFRALSLELAECNVPMLVTNHVYNVIGAYIPTNEISGGMGPKYSASSIAMLTKRKDRVETEVVGDIIKVNLTKSRFTKPNKKIEVQLSYSDGLNPYFGLVPLGVKYDVFKKVGTRIELPDGTKLFEKKIYGNPEKYIVPYMDQLEVAASKEFNYGDSISDDEADLTSAGLEEKTEKDKK